MKKLLTLLLTLTILAGTLGACKPADNNPVTSSSDPGTSKPEQPEMKLNLDLLSDLGLTYDELREKRGEVTKAVVLPGGVGYIFEKGYGSYAWGTGDISWDFPTPRDKNGNFILDELPPPKEQIQIGGIWHVQAKDLFLGLSQSVGASEIGKMYNLKIEYESVDEEDIYEGFYSYSFSCNYEDRTVNISVYTKEIGKINLDSRVNVNFSVVE